MISFPNFRRIIECYCKGRVIRVFNKDDKIKEGALEWLESTLSFESMDRETQSIVKKSADNLVDFVIREKNKSLFDDCKCISRLRQWERTRLRIFGE